MPLAFPTSEQFLQAAESLPSFECPAPDKVAFESKFDGSVSLPEALDWASGQLASGLYLAGLIMASCNSGQDYFVSDGDLSEFSHGRENVRLVVGNLVVKGDLVVTSPLIVTGNLIVEGVYRDVGSESPVAVLGDLICENMRTTGWVIVGGDTKVEHFFYGHYNDDAFECGGTLSAQAVLTEEHQILPARFQVGHTPPEGSFMDEEVFDTRQEVDILYLVDIWDDNMATVIDLDELRSCID